MQPQLGFQDEGGSGFASMRAQGTSRLEAAGSALTCSRSAKLQFCASGVATPPDWPFTTFLGHCPVVVLLTLQLRALPTLQCRLGSLRSLPPHGCGSGPAWTVWSIHPPSGSRSRQTRAKSHDNALGLLFRWP